MDLYRYGIRIRLCLFCQISIAFFTYLARVINLIKSLHAELQYSWGIMCLYCSHLLFLIRIQCFEDRKMFQWILSVIWAVIRCLLNILNFIRRCISALLDKLVIGFENYLSRRMHTEDPKAFMLFHDLVHALEMDMEEHSVDTEDGYILTLHRVSLRETETKNSETKTAPVLLVHGFQCSSTQWFFQERHKCLPYQLLTHGYDCWVANLRGNSFTSHRTISSTIDEYWAFSWHEMGIYDLPAIFNYILQRCKARKLCYIGHSMGGAAFHVCMSERPENNERIACMISMAPAVYGSHMTSHIIKWLVAPLYGQLGKWESYQMGPLEHCFTDTAWTICPFISYQSAIRLGALLAYGYGRLFASYGNDITTTQLIQIAHSSMSTSKKTMCHGMQCIYAERFQKYDYGSRKNLILYGEEIPPSYELGKTTCRVATFSSVADGIVPAEDVELLSRELPNCVGNFTISESTFSHADFLFGGTADVVVYPHVIRVLNETYELLHL